MELICFIEKAITITFFDEFAPSLQGHAAKLDQYYSSIEAPIYQTSERRNCISSAGLWWPWLESEENFSLLFLAAVKEVKHGGDNL